MSGTPVGPNIQASGSQRQRAGSSSGVPRPEYKQDGSDEKDEIIAFRRNLNYDEAEKLNQAMDENSKQLDDLEERIKEIDEKIKGKRKKKKTSK